MTPVDARRLGLAALAVVLLAAAGAALGYAAGRETPEPLVVDATPVAATDPAYPRDPVLRVLPDPDDPPLRPGLPTTRAVVGTSPFSVALPVPRGWVRSDATAGETRFYPAPPTDDTVGGYFVRVRLVGNQYLSVPAQLDARLEALSTASGIEDLTLESRSFDALVVSYVADGYRRVAMEQFLAPPGEEVASAYVAVIGRERDRDGLADLLDRLTGGLRFE